MTRRSMMHAVLGFALLAGTGAAQPAARKTQYVIFVMTDGLRWQEVFMGADAALLNKESGVSNVEETKTAFWRESASARREVLMPFLWTVVAKNGQIYGNEEKGAAAVVTNGKSFSYPGYNETLSGFPDPRVDSNDKKLNQNVTVLEWLNQKPAYKGKVAAFGSWDVFPYIINAERSGIPVIAGYAPLKTAKPSPQVELLNRLKKETEMWYAEPFDAFTFHSALEYYKMNKPKVLFLSLGDTDEWAHGGKYDLYLKSAQRFDQYVKELWETAQGMKDLRGKVSLVLAVDHGRGLAPTGWKGHGAKIPESKNIWMAYMGPDTPPMGERSNIATVTQSQIAATLAGLLGENYNAAVPNAGQPVRDALPK